MELSPGRTQRTQFPQRICRDSRGSTLNREDSGQRNASGTIGVQFGQHPNQNRRDDSDDCYQEPRWGDTAKSPHGNLEITVSGQSFCVRLTGGAVSRDGKDRRIPILRTFVGCTDKLRFRNGSGQACGRAPPR